MTTILAEAGGRECRWVTGAVAGGRTELCGEPAAKHGSWCDKHYKEVFAKNQKAAHSNMLLFARDRGYPGR